MKPLSPSASITRYGEDPGTSTGLEDLVPKKIMVIQTLYNN